MLWGNGAMDQLKLLVRQRVGMRPAGDAQILGDMGLVVHPGKHDRHLGVVPYPAERPLGRCALDLCLVPDRFDRLRHRTGQFAAAQGSMTMTPRPLAAAYSSPFVPAWFCSSR